MRPVLLAAASLLPLVVSCRTPERARAPRIERLEIACGPFVFEALAAGPRDGPLVLLLHGFPQNARLWRAQLVALGARGYRAVAFDQRGYSPRARPQRVEDYALPHLVDDVAAVADALGRRRFHLVGHDWGAAVAWVAAGTLPERVLTLTAVSTPHPRAFAAALADPTSGQALASAYMGFLRAEGAERALLEDDARRLRGIFEGSGLAPEDVEDYVRALADPAALRGALNWYRAMALPTERGGGAPVVDVPTLYVFGAADRAFTRAAAEATRRFVRGPYRFEVLEDVGHWVPEHAPERLNALLAEHLGASR